MSLLSIATLAGCMPFAATYNQKIGEFLWFSKVSWWWYEEKSAWPCLVVH